jgi:hypothetical protein
MPISVTSPIRSAIDRTRRILFRPFVAGKWFGLGFCAFLATLGEGGGGGSFGCPRGGGGGGPRATVPGPTATSVPVRVSELQQAMNWVEANIALLVIIAVAAIVLALAFTALFDWLGSRGRFMFIDGIALNRGLVSRPWREQREPANSFFSTIFLLDAFGFMSFLFIFAMGVWLAWPDLRAETFGGSAMVAAVAGAAILLPLTFVLVIAKLLLNDFVAPAMYVHRLPVGSAWSLAKREFISGRVGTIVLFYLMKLALNLAMGVIAMLAVCVTCCIAAIPYLGTVILLPLFVFNRCYALCFIEQFGPHWTIFRDHDFDGPRCTRCGYNLTLNQSGVCPECGTPTGLLTPPLAPPPPPTL